jgi:hypothetical protein
MTTMAIDYCEMCGARAGEPHHDPIARGSVVTLHKTAVDIAGKPGDEPAQHVRIVCMLCRDGIYAIRKDNARKARR